MFQFYTLKLVGLRLFGLLPATEGLVWKILAIYCAVNLVLPSEKLKYGTILGS